MSARTAACFAGLVAGLVVGALGALTLAKTDPPDSYVDITRSAGGPVVMSYSVWPGERRAISLTTLNAIAGLDVRGHRPARRVRPARPPWSISLSADPVVTPVVAALGWNGTLYQRIRVDDAGRVICAPPGPPPLPPPTPQDDDHNGVEP